MMGGNQFPFGMQRGGLGMMNAAEHVSFPDTAETIKISALALLKMLKHCIHLKIYIWRQKWNSIWSNGSNARRVYWWIHDTGGWCLCNAINSFYCECGVCRPSFSIENGRNVKGSREKRRLCRLVSFTPRIWVLALYGWYLNLKELWTVKFKSCCSCGGSSLECQRESSYGSFQIYSS